MSTDETTRGAERRLLWWTIVITFFANVPNGLLVFWTFFWITRTDAAPSPNALWFNLGLFVAFAASHSLMATDRFKQWFARFLPPAYERASFVIVAGVALLLVMALWRPMPTLLWQVHGWPGRVLDLVFWLSVLGTASVNRAFNAAQFVGTAQIKSHVRGRPLQREEFVVRGWFRYCRHPIYFFTIVMLWSASTLTTGRLLINLVATAYFLIGAQFEERRLLRVVGEPYARYCREVSMFIPWPNRYVPDASSAPRVPPVRAHADRPESGPAA